MCSEGNWTELILWFMELNIYCNSKVMPKHCKHFLCPTSAGDDKLWNIGVWYLSRFFLIYNQLLHHCFSLYTSGKNPYNVHSNNAIFCNNKRFISMPFVFSSNFNNFFRTKLGHTTTRHRGSMHTSADYGIDQKRPRYVEWFYGV